MASHAIRPNEELILTGYLRSRLQGGPWAQALVSNRLTARADGEEVAPRQDYAVIVRSDGGPALEPPTFLCRIGVRIFGPDGDDNHMLTSGFARHVAALLTNAWAHAPQVAATRATNGPYRVPPDLGRPEMYLTAELVFVGDPINL